MSEGRQAKEGRGKRGRGVGGEEGTSSSSSRALSPTHLVDDRTEDVDRRQQRLFVNYTFLS